jgi:hypothetical protein
LVRTVSADLDEGVGEIVGQRVGGGAGLVVGPDFHDPVAAGITNEFLDAPARLSLDMALVMTGRR